MSKKSENRTIAKRYAQALLELAGSDAASMVEPARTLGEACAQPEVDKFLNNPLFTRSQSAEIIGSLFDKIGAPKLLKDTAVQMANNRRLFVLADMLELFVQMVEAQQQIIRVKIVSAKALSEADVAKLSEKIAQCYSCKLNVETEVQPSLIGGVQLHMGDKHIDYSVAGKLERIGQYLKHSPMPKAS